MALRQRQPDEIPRRLSKQQLEEVEKEIHKELAKGNLLDANALFQTKVPKDQKHEMWLKLRPKLLEAGEKAINELDGREG